MPKVTRAIVLATLQDEWGTYVARFGQLDSTTQAAWLEQQGYRRFADLLAHVLAWWAAGEPAIQAMLADPSWAAPPIDVSAFNAAAVAHWQKSETNAVVRAFEAQRTTLTHLVSNLPPETWQQEAIVNRLDMEVIGHLVEHALPSPARATNTSENA